MKHKNIPFSPPDMSEDEINEVADTLRNGWITTGPKVKEFERQIADFVGVNKAVCLNSQTACAEMALRVLGVGEGDEVIVPAYTYTASASVVCHVGAKLVLVDVQKDNLEMDYDALEKAITEKTKVIIPVDLGGVPCDYDRIYEIVEKKKTYLNQVIRFKKRWEESQSTLIQRMLLVLHGMEKCVDQLLISVHLVSMLLKT